MNKGPIEHVELTPMEGEKYCEVYGDSKLNTLFQGVGGSWLGLREPAKLTLSPSVQTPEVLCPNTVPISIIWIQPHRLFKFHL